MPDIPSYSRRSGGVRRRMAAWSLLAPVLLAGAAEAQLGPPREQFFRPAPDVAGRFDAEKVYPQGRLFPFSFFSVHGDLMDRVQECGIRMVGPQYGNRDDEVLAEAKERGLKMLYSIGLPREHVRSGQWTEEEVVAAVSEQVRRVMHEDAIAWWYLKPEELRFWRPAEMRYLELAAKTIRATDPQRRPVWMYEPGHRWAEDLARTAAPQDIVGKGMYTNYSGMKDSRVWCRWTIEQQMRAIAEGNPRAVPIAVPEMFRQPPEEDLHLIPAWVRHDVYAALVAGARGVVVYSAARRRNFAAHGEYLSAYCQVARELVGELNLGQVLLFGEVRDHIEVDVAEGPQTVSTRALRRMETTFEYPSVSFLDIAWKAERYVFVVNSTPEPLHVMVGGLPYGDVMVENLLEGGEPFLVPEGDFPLDMPPWGVNVFRVRWGGPPLRVIRTPAMQLAEKGYAFAPDDFVRAAVAGDAEAVRLFLEGGMDANALNADRTTALMWAAGEGHAEIVRILLQAGADINLPDPDYWTPLLWARRAEREEVAKLLEEAGAQDERTFRRMHP